MTHCVCLLISQLLALKTVDIIQLKQETPYGDIGITRTVRGSVNASCAIIYVLTASET